MRLAAADNRSSAGLIILAVVALLIITAMRSRSSTATSS
jgi:hypothetical protein